MVETKLIELQNDVQKIKDQVKQDKKRIKTIDKILILQKDEELENERINLLEEIENAKKAIKNKKKVIGYYKKLEQ